MTTDLDSSPYNMLLDHTPCMSTMMEMARHIVHVAVDCDFHRSGPDEAVVDSYFAEFQGKFFERCKFECEDSKTPINSFGMMKILAYAIVTELPDIVNKVDKRHKRGAKGAAKDHGVEISDAMAAHTSSKEK